jgi:hypothetical protein
MLVLEDRPVEDVLEAGLEVAVEPGQRQHIQVIAEHHVAVPLGHEADHQPGEPGEATIERGGGLGHVERRRDAPEQCPPAGHQLLDRHLPRLAVAEHGRMQANHRPQGDRRDVGPGFLGEPDPDADRHHGDHEDSSGGITGHER